MGLTALWALELAIITWRDLHRSKIWPLPSDYVGATILFGGMGIVSHLGDRARQAATAFGGAIVLATVLGLWDPQNPTNVLGKAAQAPAGSPSAPIGQPQPGQTGAGLPASPAGTPLGPGASYTR